MQEAASKVQETSNSSLLVFVCGLSGAGRSTALDAFSDKGFFTIENLPVPLCENLLSYSRQSSQKLSRIAIAPELGEKDKVDHFINLLEKLKFPSSRVKLLFLDCKKEVILKRYGTTRRPHPSFNINLDLSLEDAIGREKEKLSALRDLANITIDTSELNLHELRRDINAFIASLGSTSSNLIRVNLVAFGFKYGIPNDCDFVTDVRFLPNPYFVPELKQKTGLDQEVKEFVLKQSATAEFLKLALSNYEFLIQKHAESGRLYINIGIGCTGGQHRSVALASELASALSQILDVKKYSVSLRTRDISKH
jgi:UPF0042 nucleotide-binding protein